MKRLFVLTLLVWLLQGTSVCENVPVYNNVFISDDSTYLDMSATKIGDMNKFRTFLEQHPQLKSVDMYATRLSLKAMETLKSEFPDITFGCTFGFIRGAISTNTEAFSTFNHLDDPKYRSSKFDALKHLTRLRALDLGHNHIKELEFLIPHEDLRILILAECDIEDIAIIGQLSELRYLELFNNDIVDLSPLAKLDQLEHLNLCHNPYTDVSPLLRLTQLKRLWISKNHLTDAQVKQLEESLPDTEIFYSWNDCTGGGWRQGTYYKTLMRVLKSGKYEPFVD